MTGACVKDLPLAQRGDRCSGPSQCKFRRCHQWACKFGIHFNGYPCSKDGDCHGKLFCEKGLCTDDGPGSASCSKDEECKTRYCDKGKCEGIWAPGVKQCTTHDDCLLAQKQIEPAEKEETRLAQLKVLKGFNLARIPSLGSPKAPVHIIAFQDPSCGMCKHWMKDTFPTIRKQWIESAKVRLHFVDFPLGMAALSTRSVHCITQCPAVSK